MTHIPQETDNGERACPESLLWDANLVYLNLLNKKKDGVDITLEDDQEKETTVSIKLVKDSTITYDIRKSYLSKDKGPISYRNDIKKLKYSYSDSVL